MCCLHFAPLSVTNKTLTNYLVLQPFDLQTAAADLTCTLPAPRLDGVACVMIWGPANAQTLTVLPNGSEKLVVPASQVATSYVMSSGGQVTLWQSDGTNWALIG